ncbi:hypothetical protein B0H17DRAFT_1183627 [Mycena rosella]|uniref:Ubiquitin-like protease family profile domain-containing protein n=1 Tax=Mycena rosella TaxID=1033263 RepID=A0AAD7CZ78_MYCRO|nr:hypothetical protein B0H17DRAFT_1183627 [Mycena rosella]
MGPESLDSVVPERERQKTAGRARDKENMGDTIGILFKRATRNALGMRPPGWSTQRSGPRKLWFDKVNIFTANLLVVPVYWELMTNWLLCSVFFKLHQIRIYDSITARGTRRHRAVYDRMREMLMWEHKGQYNGIPLADSWAQFSSDSVIIVPQQDNTVDCGIYTIANAENLVRNLEPAPTSYTAASAAVDRIKIANRLNVSIRSLPINHAALGAAPATTLAAPAIATPPPAKITARRWVPSKPEGHITFFPSTNPNLKGLLLPAKTLAVTSQQAELMWHCNTLFMEQADKPVGPFTCPLAEWEAAAGRSCKSDELVPLQWPAARGAGCSGNSALTSLPPTALSLRYCAWERTQCSAIFMGRRRREDYRAARLTVDPVAETFDFEAAIFSNFQWFQIASHEAMIYQFAGR